jgi:hypothetical protein
VCNFLVSENFLSKYEQLIIFTYIDASTLTPKGLGLPYVGFSDSRQADVNAINFWIFWKNLRL